MNATRPRTMREISLEERRQILLELETEVNRVVLERHSIDNKVLQHIRYYHGRGNGERNKSKGDWYKDLLGDEESPHIKKIRELKKKGYNSKRAADEMGMSLEKMNKIYINP